MKGLDAFRKLIPPTTMDIDIDNEQDQDQENEARTDDEISHEQEDDDNDEIEESDDEINLELSFANVKGIGLELMGFPKEDLLVLRDGTCICASFPTGYSQGGLNGRNGSSACSVISLIAGYYFTRNVFNFETELFSDVLPLYLGCMEMGNFIHDASGFLTVQEAIGRVPSLSISAADERNLYFSDLLEFIGNIERSQFLLVISGCSTVCVTRNEENYTLFDSHQRNGRGSLIVSTRSDNLEDVVKNIFWEKKDEIGYGQYIDVYW